VKLITSVTTRTFESANPTDKLYFFFFNPEQPYKAYLVAQLRLVFTKSVDSNFRTF